MSTALFWAKQGTSTLAPVGNVYVDDVKGNRSCGSIFLGQESETILFGLFADLKGNCENIHARAASTSWIWFASPPCTSHSKNRKGVLSSFGPDGKEVPQRANVPIAKDIQRRRHAIKQSDMSQSVWVYWPIVFITASICVSKSFFWPGSCLIFATQASQMVFLFSHSLRLQKDPQEKGKKTTRSDSTILLQQKCTCTNHIRAGTKVPPTSAHSLYTEWKNCSLTFATHATSWDEKGKDARYDNPPVIYFRWNLGSWSS